MVEREPRPRLFERVPAELKVHTQWVVWQPAEERKVPVNPATLGNAGVTWPNTWASFADAMATAERHGLGVGFVLTEADPYTCVDLDACVRSKWEVDARTREILDRLAGYVELSPSETGLHIWIRNEEPVNRRTKGIEVYSHRRWMTITGRCNPQAPREIPDRTAELQSLLHDYFPEAESPFLPLSSFPVGDEDLWDRLFNSEHGDFFRALHAGDTAVCYNDHSRAVILLANQLALMTDGDGAAMKRLLYQTGLVRDKWEERRGSVTWIEYQIQDAIAYVLHRHR